MNEPVNLPPDAPRDPLLDALRERLGDYGAPPPPGAWAGIQQRLPAPVLPWWRRPRRLLSLLALLLLVGVAGYLLSHSGHLGSRPAAPLASHSARVPAQRSPISKATDHEAISTSHSYSTPDSIAAASPNAARLKTQPDAAILPATTTTPSSASPTTLAEAPLPAVTKAAPLAVATAADSRRLAQVTRRAAAQLNTAKSLRNRPVIQQATAGRAAPSRRAGRTAATAAGATSQLRHQRTAAARLAHLRHPASGLNPQGKALIATAQPLAKVPGNERTRTSRQRTDAAQRHLARPASFFNSEPHLARRTRRPSGLVARQARRGEEHAITNEAVIAAQPTALAAGSAGQLAARAATAPASLALRRAGLLLLAPAALPGSLAARPDSSPPARPVRRWALLATAGPTLSYRTIGATPAALGTRPDFAHLERPAVGLGAQVQVRRVLSGRWALAVGLGYQEYATRLALQQVDSGRTTHLNLRDTYRLLTLPVQLSYALGAPRGRLAKALLLGAEVGWYRGGHSTEGSDCHCQQQTYSATSSPYRPWSLALSLGLDVRYRLGGPAGRWQWAVQPTGRYVLTPFLKPQAAYFSDRQPFSLGLLTGFSWDIR